MFTLDFPEELVVQDKVKDELLSSSTLSLSSSDWITLRVLFVPLDIIISSPALETWRSGRGLSEEADEEVAPQTIPPSLIDVLFVDFLPNEILLIMITL